MNGTGPGRLTGKRAVVTGSSRGIGRAIAIELARSGADVLVHGGTNEIAAMETVDQIRHMGRRAKAVVVDLSNPAAYDPFIAQAWTWAEGDVQIWVNNAGADILTGKASQLAFEEKLRRLWQVDVCATVGLGRRAGMRMRQAAGDAGDHVILNMGWDRAATGMAGDSGELFATIKGAVMAFTRSLAKSLAPSVRVNCLAPGWIRTAWSEQASRYWQQRAEREALRARWGTPSDVAHAACFLVSPRADFITGQILPVNGGLRDDGFHDPPPQAGHPT